MNSPSPNIQIHLISERNPWEAEKDDFPRLHPVGAVILSLFLLMASAYHPALNPPAWVSFVLLAACGIALISIVRSPIVTVSCAALLLLGYLFGGATGVMDWALAWATMLVSQTCALGIGAYLIATVRSYALLVIPAGSYAVALLLCYDPLLALLPLLIFPAIGMLAYQTMSNRPRIAAIAMTTLIHALCTLFGFALWWYLVNGPLPLDKLFSLIEETRAATITQLLQDEELITQLTEYFSTAGITATPAEYIRYGTEQLINLLPALLITLFNLIAYTAQRMCTFAFMNTNRKQLVTRASRFFYLSVFSAIVFLFASICALFVGTSTLFGAVMYNFWIILYPGMLLIGVQKLIGDLRAGISRLWLFILIGCAIFAPSILLHCLAISGALHCLFRPLIARLILKNGPPPGDSNDRQDR